MLTIENKPCLLQFVCLGFVGASRTAFLLLSHLGIDSKVIAKKKKVTKQTFSTKKTIESLPSAGLPKADFE